MPGISPDVTVLLFIALVLFIHWFADFIMQTDDMALNKSKCNKALFHHCLIYGICFFVPFGWKIGLIAFGSHFIIDYVTSRINSKLWKAERRGAFFNMIGFDQMLHLIVIFGALIWI